MPNALKAMIQRQTQAIIALFIMTFFWGLTFPFIHAAIHDINTPLFVIIRFLIASVILLPFVITQFKHTTAQLLIDAIILGLLNGFACISQSIGLETTSVTHSAFITGLFIIFVPFLSPLFKVGTPSMKDILAALIALCGIVILTQANINTIGAGELWTFGCAVSYALYVLTLQRVTTNHQHIMLLVFYQLIVMTLFPFIFISKEPIMLHWTPPLIYALLYCAIFATALGIILQSTFQRYINPTQASIIYTFEPVFAALAAWVAIDEAFSRHTVIGAVILLLSFLVSQIKTQKIDSIIKRCNQQTVRIAINTRQYKPVRQKMPSIWA